MQFSHARAKFYNAPLVSGHWRAVVMNGAEVRDHAQAVDVSQASNVEDDNISHMVLNPYDNLKNRIFAKIANGVPMGEVLDYLFQQLEGEELSFIYDRLVDFAVEFKDMGLHDYAYAIGQELMDLGARYGQMTQDAKNVLAELQYAGLLPQYEPPVPDARTFGMAA